MEKFHLHELSEKGESLLKEAKATVGGLMNPEIAQKAKEIPASLTSSDGNGVTIAFCGGYSSGKSSIISLLTGIKLDIGAGVTTQMCNTLDWNGLKIIDTPGVKDQNRPDHDKVTYDAIAKADLLVFVVAYNGFGGFMGEHFRELAIERKKGGEMMIVVNKMDCTAQDNVPEQQDIIFNGNIAPVINPYTREGMYTTFVSADHWREAISENDRKYKEMLASLGGGDQLIANLNRFAKEKGIVGKQTTSLYELEKILTDAIANYKSGDDCADATKEILNRQRRALKEAKRNVEQRAHDLIRNETAVVPEWGSEIANSITPGVDEKELEARIKFYTDKVDEVFSKAVEKLNKIVEDASDGLDRDFTSIAQSDTGRFVISEINSSLGVNSSNTMRKMAGWGEKAKGFGQWLAKMAKGSNAKGGWENFFKVKEASGSQARNIIYSVGKFFGHKFKPYGATTPAARIGQVGKVLGALGAALSVLAQILADMQEKEMERKLADARAGIRTSFNEAANAINMKFDESTQKWVEENFGRAIKEVDENIRQISDATIRKEGDYNTLTSLLDKTRGLIAAMQSA